MPKLDQMKENVEMVFIQISSFHKNEAKRNTLSYIVDEQTDRLDRWRETNLGCFVFMTATQSWGLLVNLKYWLDTNAYYLVFRTMLLTYLQSKMKKRKLIRNISILLSIVNVQNQLFVSFQCQLIFVVNLVDDVFHYQFNSFVAITIHACAYCAVGNGNGTHIIKNTVITSFLFVIFLFFLFWFLSNVRAMNNRYRDRLDKKQPDSERGYSKTTRIQAWVNNIICPAQWEWVTYPSTNHARCCLTSVIKLVLVVSY